MAGFREIRADFQRLPVMDDRLVDLSTIGQGKTEVVEGFREIRLDFQALSGNGRQPRRSVRDWLVPSRN